MACHGQGGAGGAGPDGMNVEVISLIGGSFGLVGERFANRQGVMVGGSFRGSIPGLRDAGSVIDDIVNMHITPELAVGKMKNGFVVSANGITLKVWVFDVKTDLESGDLMLSYPEGTIKANTFIIRPDDDALMKIHPGLIAAPSAVIHHFGVEPGYEEWRSHLKARYPGPTVGERQKAGDLRRSHPRL